MALPFVFPIAYTSFILKHCCSHQELTTLHFSLMPKERIYACDWNSQYSTVFCSSTPLPSLFQIAFEFLALKHNCSHRVVTCESIILILCTKKENMWLQVKHIFSFVMSEYPADAHCLLHITLLELQLKIFALMKYSFLVFLPKWADGRDRTGQP